MKALPPRLAEWVMERSLVPGDRAVVLGDLHEEFRTRAARDGTKAARRWYRHQVRRSLPFNLRRIAAHALESRLAAPARRSRRHRSEVVMQDIRLAVRSLLATPTFTIVALVVLALGIGATTAIFSVVDAVVLKGVPFPRGDRLVAVSEPALRNGGRNANVAPADYVDFRARQSTFEDLAAVRGRGVRTALGDLTESPLVMASQRASFPCCGSRRRSVEPSADGEDLARRVAILSDGPAAFSADPAILGRTPLDRSWTIVGVMPVLHLPIALRRR